MRSDMSVEISTIRRVIIINWTFAVSRKSKLGKTRFSPCRSLERFSHDLNVFFVINFQSSNTEFNFWKVICRKTLRCISA